MNESKTPEPSQGRPIEDGGPAYPLPPTYHEGMGMHSGQPGMTLRDAFAIHAPQMDMQRLNFQPVMRKKPEVPKRTSGTEFDAAVKCYADFEFDTCGWPEGKNEIRSWDGQLVALTPELKAEVEAYIKAAKVYEIDKAAWYQEHAEQMIAQWPWRYADLVLAARKAVAHG